MYTERIKTIFEKVSLVMPTRGRAKLSSQKTIQNLAPSIAKNLLVVTAPDEVEALTKEIGHLVKTVAGVPHNNIGELRQSVLDALDKENIIFVDDSLNFHVRHPSELGSETKYPLKGICPQHFTPQTIERLYVEMLEWMVAQLDSNRFGMVGLSARPANNFNEESYSINKRVCGVWGINNKLYHSLPVRPNMALFPIKEDMYMELSFLTHGIPCISYYHYAFDRMGGVNTPGGCSRYRNNKNCEEHADRLAQQFPNYVKKVLKNAKSWNGFGDKVWDVRVQWNKAYLDSIGLSKLK